jgi:ribosomal protein L10
MIKKKEKKIKMLEEFKKNLENFKFLVFFSIFKLDTKTLEDLRKKLKKEKCKLLVMKKTLFKKAFSNKNLEFLEEKLPVAMILAPKLFSLPIKLLKEALEGKENSKIFGGIYENRILSEKEILQISELPSERELLGKLTFTLSSPIQKLPLIFNQILLKLIFALEQIKGQKEGK